MAQKKKKLRAKLARVLRSVSGITLPESARIARAVVRVGPSPWNIQTELEAIVQDDLESGAWGKSRPVWRPVAEVQAYQPGDWLEERTEPAEVMGPKGRVDARSLAGALAVLMGS